MYEKFYGLKTSPFRLSPDPAFFFGSKGHMRALAYLRYGINQREGFIVITGTPGTGKTTLARALLGEMGKTKTIVSELNTTHLQADDVLRMVAASYGLPHENAPKSTLLKRLEDFLIARFRAGYHILLIVDESQNLPRESLEELRMLSNFYIGKDALIQIFLLGQEQFREKLYSQEMEQLRQRVVASCHLEPLGQQETKAYIIHRLTVAGWQGSPQISERAFVRIFSVTKGVPRRINTFCDRLFLYGALENKTIFRDEEVKNVAKELSIETSPKDRNLADIKPADISDSVSVENIDTEHLTEFTDDVKDIIPPPQPSEAEKNTLIESDQDSFQNDDSRSVNTPPERFKAVSNGNDIEALDPLPESESVTYHSNEKPDWWTLVALAVEYSLAPEKYPNISNGSSPVPAGITEAFKVATGKKAIPDYLRTGVLENISDEIIQKAIRLYIKRSLLSNAADYYRRLGVEHNAEQELIRSHYKYLFRLFQPDKDAKSDEWDETFTRRINQAYGALRSEQKRKEYDAFLLTLSASKDNSNVINPLIAEIEEEEIPSIEKTSTPYSARKKTGKSFFVVAIFGAALIVLSGGGYYLYQNQLQDEGKTIDFSAISNKLGFDFNEQKNDAAIIDKVNDEISTKIEPETPLADTSRASDLPAEATKIELETKEHANFSANEIPINADLQLKETVTPEPSKEDVKKEEKPSSLENSTDENDKALNSVVSTKSEQKPKVEKNKEIKDDKKSTDAAKVVASSKPDSKKLPKETATPALAVENSTSMEPVNTIVESQIPPALETPVSPVSKIDEVVQIAKVEIEKPKVGEVVALTESELSEFISVFALAYEEGNIEKFIPMFTPDSATNDAKGRDLIKQDYATLFDSTEMRVIDLQSLVWDIRENKAIGSGGFVVTVLRKGGDTMKKFNGNIKLDVVKQNNNIQISGMFHTYGEGN